MNLAIRGIDGSQVRWNNEGSFLNNAHSDLKADFVIANPLINRKTREFRKEDISKVAKTYHQWRVKTGKYEDQPGFCASVSIEKIKELDYVLSPGRYVGLVEVEDDFDFGERFSIEKIKELDYVLSPGRYVGLVEEEDNFDFGERFSTLKAEFETQLKEEVVLNKRIAKNLAKVECDITNCGIKNK